MKTYEQMTADVLRRMNEYKIAQKRKRRIVTAVAVPICCLCLFLSVSAVMGSLAATKSYDAAVNNAGMAPEAEFMEVPDIMPVYEIVVHPLDKLPEQESEQGIALMVDDFVPMTDQEITAYYGVNILPVVPGDLTRVAEQLGIYKRNGGTGEVYYDHMRIAYEDEMQKRCIVTQAFPKTAETFGWGLLEKLPSHSVIYNTAVAIAQLPDGSYYGEFQLEDVGICVWTTGLSQQETVDVIASIITK